MSDKVGTEAIGKNLADLQAVGDAARQVGPQAQQAGAQAVHQAKDVAQEAVARGSALAGEAKDRVASAAEAQKGGLADRLEDVAQAVYRSGEQLEGHQDWVAGLVERGAAELTVLARTVRSNDLQGLMGNLQDLARRQPALFAGASLAAGFALARVGKIAAAGASSADLPQLPEMSSKVPPEGAP